jgi:hypothetical protein
MRVFRHAPHITLLVHVVGEPAGIHRLILGTALEKAIASVPRGCPRRQIAHVWWSGWRYRLGGNRCCKAADEAAPEDAFIANLPDLAETPHNMRRH